MSAAASIHCAMSASSARPRRLALVLLRQAGLIAAITVAVFFLVRVVPGDAVDVLALQGDLDDAQAEALRQDLGLGGHWLQQLFQWVLRALSGDLGRSLRFDQPVAEMVWRALPHTLALAGLSLGLGLALGVALALAAVIWPRSPANALIEMVNIWSIAFPTFCVAVAAILVFSIWLGWLPVLGQTLMPAIVLGIDIAGQIAKPLREDLRETSAAGFVRTAQAKGLSRRRIILRHILPSSLSVAVALSGLVLAGLIGGTITVEALFGLPGIGMLALDAVKGRDYPLLQAVILVIALGVVAANLLTDLLQRAIDPRIP